MTSLSLTSESFYDFIKNEGIYDKLGVSFDRKSENPSSVVSANNKLVVQFLQCDIIQKINDICFTYLTKR
jgi:hypothetical protein